MDKKICVVYSENGDWTGLYVDGRLVAESDTLQPGKVLRALGIEYESKIADAHSLEERHGCPDKLEDVMEA